MQHSIRRVRERVRKGGHDVPLEDLKRRFDPSLRNFFNRYLPLADKSALYDSTLQPPELVAKWEGSVLEVILPLEYEKIIARLR